MHRLFRKKTIVPRLLLCVLYVLFFAVQLNLRYYSVEISPFAGLAFSGGKANPGFTKTFLKESADRKGSVTTRLNKRYFPGHCCPVQSPALPSGTYQFIAQDAGIHESPFLLQQHHQLTQRRGPPSAC